MAPKQKAAPKLKKELIKNEKTRYLNFQKRRKCLEKKAFELSTLCGVDVCFIVYGPKLKDHRPIDHYDDQQPYMWPKDLNTIWCMFELYKQQPVENRKKWTLDLSHFLEKDDPKEANETDHQGINNSLVLVKVEDNKSDEAETTKNIKHPTWNDQYFNNLSGEQLREFGIKLEKKLEAVKTRHQSLKSNYQNMENSFLATQGTQENYSNYFMPLGPIIHHEQQPISFFSDVDVPDHYPRLDLSIPNSMMTVNMDDKHRIGLGATSCHSNNMITHSVASPTNSGPVFPARFGIVENNDVVTDNSRAQMCYYTPTMLPMLPSTSNLMKMNDEDYNIGLGGDFGSNVITYNTGLIYDDTMFGTVENAIMDDLPMPPPVCYYGGPTMFSSVPSYMHASF